MSTAELLEGKEAVRMEAVLHSVDDVLEIFAEIPKEDWKRFCRSKFVAVSATTKRILDGDNNKIILAQRVSRDHPHDQIYCTLGYPANRPRAK